MQPTKKQLSLAEMSFSYRALKKPISARNAQESSILLQQLWQQSTPAQAIDYYVLFLNNNREVFSWYRLPDKQKANVYALQIAGLAFSINACGVIISQCCDVKDIQISWLDRIFAEICFNECEKVNIEIFDYILCSKSSSMSFLAHN